MDSNTYSNQPDNNSIHHNDVHKKSLERFDSLIKELSDIKDTKEKLALILSLDNKDIINKYIATSRTLTIEQLATMFDVDNDSIESHFWEKFNDNDRVRTRESNLQEFHRNKALELSQKKDQSWEPIQYKWWSFK